MRRRELPFFFTRILGFGGGGDVWVMGKFF
jgi:hypothetical protein